MLKKVLLSFFTFFFIFAANKHSFLFAQSTDSIYTFIGTPQTFTVPPAVECITVKMWGAAGPGVYGGAGGYSEAVIAVTPGENLEVIVGGSNGYPDGGAGGFGGDNGGGRSAVRRTITELIDAGGGGGSGSGAGPQRQAGAGGGCLGQGGHGGGGTQIAGGVANCGGSGQFQGGPGCVENNPIWPAGGGGGGWYGGGGGNVGQQTGGGGGGGSGYVPLGGISLTGNLGTPPNITDPDYIAGIAVGGGAAGNGLVVIQWGGACVFANDTINDVSVCINDSVLLGTLQGVSYTWTPSTHLSDSTIYNPLCSPDSTTTYVINITNSSGCVLIDTITVTVNPLPNVGFTVLDSSYCANTPLVTLMPNTAGGTFNGSGISGTTFDPSAATIGNDTISYTLTDGNGCTDTSFQTTIVFAAPDASFSGLSSSYCSNTAIVILIPTTTGGSFSGNGISDSTFTPSAAGFGIDTISYVLIDDNGCMDSTAQTVVINPLPDAGFSGLVSSYCSDASVITLIPNTAGGTFTGSGISDTTFNPSSATLGLDTITYVLTDSNGCYDSTSQIVIIHQTPTVTSTSTNVLCNGDSTGTALAIASSGTGVYTFSWNSNPVQTTDTATDLTAGTYTCIVTDSNTCTASTIVIITQPIAMAALLAYTNVSCNGLTDGNASVSASGGVQPYTYSWSPLSDTTNTIDSLAAGNYTSIVTDSNGCAITQNFTINQPDSISGTITSNAACGTNNGSAQITGVNGGTGNYTYSWSPSGGTNAIAVGLGTGTYTVTITDSANCSITDTISVIVYPQPVIILSADTTINYGSSANIQATGGASYLWNPGTTLNCTSCPAPIASPEETTTYCVTTIDTTGCGDTACVTITVDRTCEIAVPKAFSPNGDGANDLECVYGNCAVSVHLTIYDRWGEKIFETNNINQCWDGTYRGKKLNSAVFVYYLDAILVDGSEIKQKGDITLIR